MATGNYQHVAYLVILLTLLMQSILRYSLIKLSVDSYYVCICLDMSSVT